LVLSFELTFFIQKSKGILFSILLIITLVIVFCVYGFFGEASQYARDTKAGLLIFVYVVSSLLPATSILWLAWLNKHLMQKEIHALAIAVAVVNTGLLPFILLFTSCYTGLDCI
jgi:Kef-type K+ transport system membrane component KefB